MYRILLFILISPLVGLSQASTHLIPIDTCYGQGNLSYFKTPGSLFNGSIISTNRLDRDGGVNSSFCTPYSFVTALGDSCYDNLRIDYFNEFNTTNWTLKMYDSNRVLLATYNFSRGFQGSGGNYTTMAGTPDTISKFVRFIFFTVSDPTNTDLRQFKIYGDPIQKCSKIIPDPVVTTRTDPGISIMGGSAIDDKDTNYLKLSNGDPLYWNYRQPEPVFVTAYNQSGTFSNQPFSFTFYGDLALRKLNFMKFHGVPVHGYYNGSCILTIPPTDSSASYPAKSASNNLKDIVNGSDSTSYAQWVNTGRMWKAITALWGRNTSATLSSDYNVYGTNTAKGQNKMIVCEIGNEDNKTWQGLTGYHSPEVLLAKLKIAYDSIKNIDPTMQVYLGATYFMDSTFLKAMYWWNYWKYGSKSLPCDGWCFNQYLSTAYGGQPQGGSYSAISPEQWQTTIRLNALGLFRNVWLPNRGIRWTESGFATSSGSNYDVHSVTGIPDTVVQANMFIRTVERVAAAPNIIDAIFNYFQTGDGSSDFNSMAVVTEKFEGGGGSYSGSIQHCLWWWIATRGQTLKNYKGWSTMLIDGDSTGVSVARYNHLTDPTKKVYYVCRGTYNGTTSTNYVVNLGATALTCNLITMAYNDENGVSTPLTITGGNVTIPTVNEGPQYLQVTFASTSGNPDVLIRGRKVKVTN